jgi:3-phenylpropionate/cinnamic acid dioxygenase small subunit
MEELKVKVAELLEKESIQALRINFAVALDNKDWKLFESLFAEEVETDWTAWGVPKQTMKKDDIVKMFSQQAFRRSELQTEHIYSNFRVNVSNNNASCVSNFVGFHHIPGFEGGDEFILRGEYADKLSKTHEGWKIHSLTLRIFYATGNAQILS